MPLLLPVFFALGALALALGSGTFWDLLSPLTHKDQLYSLGGRYKVDPLLLASIVRQESGFNPFALSRSGAVGLMQLMPATAEEAAAELGVEYDSLEDLYRDDVNLRLGAHHFAKLLRRFQGDTVLALAAYNAGSGNVRRWQLPPPGAPEIDRIDAIPVAETRSYVSGVLTTYRHLKRFQRFKRLLQGEL